MRSRTPIKPIGLSRAWLAPTSASTRAALLSGSVSSISTTRCGMSRTRLTTEREARLRIELVEQRLCLFQIGCVEAFSEPAIDRREQIVRFGAAALVAPQPGETGRGPQFPELGLLLLGNAQRFPIEFLGGFGMPLPAQQLALLPINLCCKPALPCYFHDLQSLVQQGHGLFILSRDLTCCGEESDMIGHVQLRPGCAVSRRTAAQERYSLRNIAFFYLDPATKDRSQCAPERETLLVRYRNELVCPLTEDCIISIERQQPGAGRQVRRQGRWMSQAAGFCYGFIALRHRLLREAETEKHNSQRRPCVYMRVLCGLVDQRAMRIGIVGC